MEKERECERDKEKGEKCLPERHVREMGHWWRELCTKGQVLETE